MPHGGATGFLAVPKEARPPEIVSAVVLALQEKVEDEHKDDHSQVV
jgi:hypothetical protein